MRLLTTKAIRAGIVSAFFAVVPFSQAFAFDMDDMVNEYTASSVAPNSNLSLDGRRGFMTGGSLRVRFQNKENPELYNVTLPSFKADCNGMDMNLGSLSWISADEFVDAARQMASPQVLIYALQLALNQMCGPCAQMMSDLQEKLNEYSGLLKQSCEKLGTALYEKADKKFKIAEKSAEFWDEAQDETGDDAAATEGSTVQTMLDAGRHDEINENIIWDHMVDVTVGGWLAEVAGEEVAKQMIMSMSGTTVVDATGASSESEINYNKVAPVEISLTDVVNGGEIDGLICMDNANDCLQPAPGVIIEQDPLAEQFYEMLDPHNDQSIPNKFAVHEDGISFDDDELAFMRAAQRHFDLQKFMHSLAMKGNKLPARTAEVIAETMAIEIALEFMLDYLDQATTIVGAVENQSEIQEINPFIMSAKFREEAATLREELSKKLEDDANLLSALVNASEM